MNTHEENPVGAALDDDAVNYIDACGCVKFYCLRVSTDFADAFREFSKA